MPDVEPQPEEDFDETETDTSMYRTFADGRMVRLRADGTWEEVEPDTAEVDEWAAVPPGQRMMLKIVQKNMERTTDSVVKLGEELPDKVADMGTTMAVELRTGLRNQSIAFFIAFLVLTVAVVSLAGYNMQVKASHAGTGLEVGTAP